MTASNTLTVQNVRKSYGDNLVLKGVSLKARSGELISLLGASGSGKTTLLRCIAGLELPDAESGEIRLGDQTLSGAGSAVPPERRQLGMVFQNYAVWPHLDVFENVAFPLHIQARQGRIQANEIERRAREAISLVKLAGLEHRFAHELSGGQQQRVALARALGMSPRLLLLDEPLSNLDALLREELGAEIRRIQKQLGLTAILVTHDQKEALSLSDRVVLLKDGRIDCEGSPEELYQRPPTEFAAIFLAGGQCVQLADGTTRTFLPRRWRQSPTQGFAVKARVVSRLFQGSEYHYLGRVEGWDAPLQFYSPERFETGAEIPLHYENDRTR